MTARKQKRVRVPWWLVPEKILLDVAKSTGFDPAKMKWIVTVKEGKHHYGVAG